MALAAGSEPDEGNRPARTSRRLWAWVPHALEVVVRVVQLIYYTLAVWREL